MAVAQFPVAYANGGTIDESHDISLVELARSPSTSTTQERLSDFTLTKGIWGFFYYLSKITFQLQPLDPGSKTKGQKFVQYLPNIISMCLLFARAFYMLYYMLTAPDLTIIFCYTKCLFFFAIQGGIAASLFILWRQNDFYLTTITMFRKATKENFTLKISLFKSAHITYYIFILLYIIGMAYYCVQNVVQYHDKVDVYKLHKMPHNETESFRNSMFGPQVLFPLDIIIILWGAYLSSICLVIYMCTNNALCHEYSMFLKKLRSRMIDKSILKLEVIESVEEQLIDYLKLVKFVNENVLRILEISFIIGIFSYLISLFCVKSFSDFIGNDKATFFIWIGVSICLLGIALNCPAQFNTLVNETVDIFYLDHGIWRECTEEKVKNVARDILNRLKDADYGSKGVSFGTAGAILFNLILIVIPFLVNLLSPYAVMPMPLKDL